MPPCSGCGKSFDPSLLSEGYCAPCYEKFDSRREEDKKDRIRMRKITEERIQNENKLKGIILTTENDPNLEITERIEIISAECVYGMNIFRDMFSGVRDIVGGRSKSSQNVLRDARREVLRELRDEAFSIGANAVIAIDLNYSEFSGGGKSMLFVVATGTAVKIKI